MSEPLTIDRVAQLRYRPSSEADEFLEHSVRRTLINGERYRAARLAIARSIYETTPPPLLPKGTDFALPIEGSHLWGDDKSVWACAITDSWPEPIDTPEVLKAVVEAHWHRGAALLKPVGVWRGGRAHAESAATAPRQTSS